MLRNTYFVLSVFEVEDVVAAEARTEEEFIEAGAAKQLVVAAVAKQGVVTGEALESIVVGRTAQGVVFGCASNDRHGEPHFSLPKRVRRITSTTLASFSAPPRSESDEGRLSTALTLAQNGRAGRVKWVCGQTGRTRSW